MKITKRLLMLLLCLSFIVVVFSACNRGRNDYDLIVVGRTFAEGQIMAEVMAMLIENQTDLRVGVIQDLTATIAFEAVALGEAQIMTMYTGTAVVAHLGEGVLPGAPFEETFERARDGLLEEFDIVVFERSLYNNTFALGVSREFAEANNVWTYSDLIPFTPNMIFVGEHAFFDRPDGFHGMSEAYGFEFADYTMVDVGLKYAAFEQDRMGKALIVFSTDSQIVTFDVVVLEDDQGFFPAYYGHVAVRRDTLEQFPELETILSVLAGIITSEEMTRFNYLVDSGQINVQQAAALLISEFGL